MSESLNKITEACRFLLLNYPEAQQCQEYLDSRINKESQELFKFGYFPNIKNLAALISLLGQDLLEKDKFLFSKEIEDSLYPRMVNFCHFEDYPLIMPFKDAYGNTVGIVGRTLFSEDERKDRKIPKYKNSLNFNKTNHLFGLFENKQNIIDKDCVYLVEGQFDVIKATEKGYNNIVGIGSCHLSLYQFSIINRYTNNIFLLLDNDEAGYKGRKKTIETFGKFANIQNFYLPENFKDIDEYLTNVPHDDVEFTVKA